METSRDASHLLRSLRMQGPEAERLRRRCAAIAAAVVFVLCLLVALGLGYLALVVLVALAVVGLGVAAQTHGLDRVLRERIDARSRRTTRPRPVPESSYGWPSRLDEYAAIDEPDATAEMAAVAPAAEPRPPRAARVSRVVSGLRQAAAFSATAPPEDEGLRCNALGVELRRAGRVQQAATLHEAARLLYEEAGDSRGEALAANALGVALVELGDDDAALEQFQQARALLHEIGDRQWEAKVLANEAVAKNRVGREDEAADLLRSALANLPPESEAYQRVEQRLEQAS